MKRNFLTLKDLQETEVSNLVNLAIEVNRNREAFRALLEDLTVAIYFKETSTRTRTAFTVAAQKLGANVITYGPNDLQIATGETLSDTGLVLSRFVDALVARTNESLDDLRELSSNGRLPVVNAMTRCEHPTQVIGDMVTIHELFGRINDIHILYMGEGNNTAAALALIAAKLGGLKLSLMTPEKYRLSDEVFRYSRQLADKNRSEITQSHNPGITPLDVDIVYTTRWETMGVKHDDPNWREDFRPFQVNAKFMDRLTRKRGRQVIFMHDLPAIRGSDTTSDVLDGPASVAFRQAYHKLTGAMAVLSWVIGERSC